MSRAAVYGAVTAKARAMYAHRLTEDTWTQLEALDSVRRIAEQLRQSGTWPLAAVTDDARALYDSLSDELRDRYRRLCLYLRHENDREYMAFFLKRKAHALSYPNEAYDELADCIRKSYHGLSRLVLQKLLGAEADMLNLVYILRLRRFPASLPTARERLIPVHAALKRPIIEALIAAPDDEAAAKILAATPWAEALRDMAPEALDGAYERYMERLCRKLVMAGECSPAIPMAYMMLSELERLRLTRLIAGAEQRSRQVI